MKKYVNWRLTITFLLISASVITYASHYFIFRDVHHIFIYMIGDIAFLFLDVLLVILVIERLLAQRERRALMKKLNMVIGTFFSEVGMELLKKFSTFVEHAPSLEKEMTINPDWNKKDFLRARKAATSFSYDVHIEKATLPDLRDYLLSKRVFLLRLLENPNLLEHDRFTDLLWAVFHLMEELAFRGDELEDLPESDLAHLAGDLQRAYSQITAEWIAYTGHLKESYPFLFSLAARVNPFSPHPSAIVT